MTTFVLCVIVKVVKCLPILCMHVIIIIAAYLYIYKYYSISIKYINCNRRQSQNVDAEQRFCSKVTCN